MKTNSLAVKKEYTASHSIEGMLSEQLETAVSNGDFTKVVSLCQKNKNIELKIEDFVRCASCAASNDDYAVFDYLCVYFPNDKIQRGDAIGYVLQDVINWEFFSGYYNRYSINQPIVDGWLKSQVEIGNAGRVKQLCLGSELNRPSIQAIDDALKLAAKQADKTIFQDLCELNGKIKPSAKTIANVLAASWVGPNFFHYFFERFLNNDHFLEKLLIALVKLMDLDKITRYFNNEESISVSQDAIAIASAFAAKNADFKTFDALYKTKIKYQSDLEIINREQAWQEERNVLINYYSCYKLEQEVIDCWVIGIAKCNNLDYLRAYFQEGRLNFPSPRGIGGVLILAARYANYEIFDFLCSLEGEHKPTVEIINWVLDAGGIEYTFIAHYYTKYKLNQTAIDSWLVQVVQLQRLDLVKLFCQTDGLNHPSSLAIAKALNYAASAENRGIFDFLCSLKGNYKPTKEMISKALNICSIGWSFRFQYYLQVELSQEIVDGWLLLLINEDHFHRFYEESAYNAPSRETVFNCLKIAANRNDRSLFDYLCGLKEEVKPSECMIGEALRQTDVKIEFFSRNYQLYKLDQNQIDSCLIDHVKNERFFFVEAICRVNPLNAPTLAAKKEAARLAAKENKFSLFRFLCKKEGKFTLSLKDIAEAVSGLDEKFLNLYLEDAIENQEFIMLQGICQAMYPQHLSEERLLAEAAKAANKEGLEHLRYLCNFPAKHKLSQSQIAEIILTQKFDIDEIDSLNNPNPINNMMSPLAIKQWLNNCKQEFQQAPTQNKAELFFHRRFIRVFNFAPMELQQEIILFFFSIKEENAYYVDYFFENFDQLNIDKSVLYFILSHYNLGEKADIFLLRLAKMDLLLACQFIESDHKNLNKISSTCLKELLKKAALDNELCIVKRLCQLKKPKLNDIEISNAINANRLDKNIIDWLYQRYTLTSEFVDAIFIDAIFSDDFERVRLYVESSKNQPSLAAYETAAIFCEINYASEANKLGVLDALFKSRWSALGKLNEFNEIKRRLDTHLKAEIQKLHKAYCDGDLTAIKMLFQNENDLQKEHITAVLWRLSPKWKINHWLFKNVSLTPGLISLWLQKAVEKKEYAEVKELIKSNPPNKITEEAIYCALEQAYKVKKKSIYLLLSRAYKSGNWLEELIDSCIKKKVKVWWRIVLPIYMITPIAQNTVDTLFTYAIEKNKYDKIKYLLRSDSYNKPSNGSLEKCFDLLAAQGSLIKFLEKIADDETAHVVTEVLRKIKYNDDGCFFNNHRLDQTQFDQFFLHTVTASLTEVIGSFYENQGFKRLSPQIFENALALAKGGGSEVDEEFAGILSECKEKEILSNKVDNHKEKVGEATQLRFFKPLFSPNTETESKCQQTLVKM